MKRRCDPNGRDKRPGARYLDVDTGGRATRTARRVSTLDDFVEESLSLVASLFYHHNVVVQKEVEGDLPFTPANRHQMLLLVGRGLHLALTAVAGKKTQRVLKIKAAGMEKRRVRIEILDNGREAPPALWESWLRFSPCSDIQHKGGQIVYEHLESGENVLRLEVSNAGQEGPAGSADELRVRKQPTNILVVDDEPAIINVVTQFLRQKGFRADGVESCYEATFRLEKTQYDLILLDLKMPGMHGSLFLEAISREMPALVDRVILVSGHAEEAEACTMKYGCPFLPKPVSLSTLLTTIEQKLAEPRKHHRILVLDDSSTMRRHMRELLHGRGYEVDSLDNGYEGLMRLRKTRYDLIVSDLEMLGMDGTLLYQTVSREFPELRHRFIVVSAHISEFADLLQEMGCPFLSKPFEPDEFCTLVDKTLAAMT